MIFIILAIIYGLIAIGVAIGITQNLYETRTFSSDMKPVPAFALSILQGIVISIFWPALFAYIFVVSVH
jgi:hypothetical protein